MEYGVLGWIVVGLVAGALAKWILPGKDPGGIVITILIGIAGGLLGGYISSMLGIGGGSDIVNTLVATAGAVVLLWLYRVMKSRQAR